jgi:hypothetical protein
MDEVLTGVPEKGSLNRYRLYNPLAFPILAPLFSLLLPGILYSINVGRINGRKKRNLLILLFAGLEVLLFAAVFIFSPILGNYAKYAFEAINIFVGVVLQQNQKAAYQEWLVGAQKPRRVIWPIAIACVPVAMIVFFMLKLPTASANVHETLGDKVYYGQGVTETDARTVADDLVKAGLFAKDQNTFELMLKKDPDGLVLLIPLKKEFIGTNEAVDFVSRIEKALKEDAYYKDKMRVVASDTKFREVN